eukprot:3407289-Heterocapsa_arctica.AAC.1
MLHDRTVSDERRRVLDRLVNMRAKVLEPRGGRQCMSVRARLGADDGGHRVRTRSRGDSV